MHEYMGLLFGLVNTNENGYPWFCFVFLIYNEQVAINIPGIFITIILTNDHEPKCIYKRQCNKNPPYTCAKKAFETQRFELKRVWRVSLSAAMEFW